MIKVRVKKNKTSNVMLKDTTFLRKLAKFFLSLTILINRIILVSLKSLAISPNLAELNP
jgi:hypothetical protein